MTGRAAIEIFTVIYEAIHTYDFVMTQSHLYRRRKRRGDMLGKNGPAYQSAGFYDEMDFATTYSIRPRAVKFNYRLLAITLIV